MLLGSENKAQEFAKLIQRDLFRGVICIHAMHHDHIECRDYSDKVPSGTPSRKAPIRQFNVRVMVAIHRDPPQ